MYLQSQFKSKVPLVKIEPLTVIKNEPEIGMDQDITSADIKDEIDIEYHLLSEDLIKSEPIPNNILESEHLESIDTQIFIQTENTPFIKTKFENLVKTQDTNDGNLSVVLGSTAKMDNCRLRYHCNKCKYKTLWRKNLDKHKVIHLKPNKIQYLCYHCPFKSNYKGNLTCHVFNHFKNGEVPFHCYICDFVTPKTHLIFEHFKKHPEHCSKWNDTEYKNQVEAYTKKYQVKPNKIQYLCCYHCTYRSVNKSTLRIHIFRHFKNEEVPFHCYICDFLTVKRYLIIEHFKKHPEHRSKCDETDYKITLKVVKKRYYYCKKCMFRTCQCEKLKLHELTHKETDDRYLKYQCDKCTYKTINKGNFKVHQLIHLKPEEIQYFYCYHCSYKAKQKIHLKNHMLGHKNANSKTRKRKSMTEHIKKHSKVQGKSKINKRTK